MTTYKKTPTLTVCRFNNKTMLTLHSNELGVIIGYFKIGMNMESISKELRHMADKIDNKTEEYKKC